MENSSRALVCRTSGPQNQLQLVEQNPLPRPEPHQVLVRVLCVAQNPTDVQAFDTNAFGDDAVLGCDFVGLVEKIGERVTRVKKGDRIAGLIWGGETKGLGAYSSYIIADEKICFRVPEKVPSAQAATVPLAVTTAWLALYSKQCLAIDRSRGKEIKILVWGGSSSVGLYTLQIARMHDFEVITVCSPKHFDTCKKHGATHVFDYRSPSVIEDIIGAVPDITHVFDYIGSATSSAEASKALIKEGARLCTVRPGKANTENVDQGVKITDVLVWTCFLKDHRYKDFFWPADLEDHEIACDLYEKLPEYLEDRSIMPNSHCVLEGGLKAVAEGFQMYRNGEISGFKLVYTFD